MKVSKGIVEDGIVVGNNYDKYQTQNIIAKKLMQGFEQSLGELVSLASPTTIHEVGCGEGYWVMEWVKKGLDARGSDFSAQVIELARENSAAAGMPDDLFQRQSIYDFTANDTADLVVCCEVLEHLESPQEALEVLSAHVDSYVLLSVPRERIWCVLNMMRGKYLSDFGNTPGHLQHWSKRGFVNLVSHYFDIVSVRSPLPWTMLLAKKKNAS